jgi:hypothetical protein
MTPALAEDRAQAADLAGAVWQAILLSGGLRTAAFRHFPAAFDASLLAALPLPLAARPGRPVAMAGASGAALDRYTDPAAF